MCIRDRGLVVLVEGAGNTVATIHQKSYGLFKIIDNIRIGPEVSSRLIAVLGVLFSAAPPLPIINQRDNDPHTNAVSDLENFIESSESLFIEFTCCLLYTSPS